jgi:hypothetical protein
VQAYKDGKLLRGKGPLEAQVNNPMQCIIGHKGILGLCRISSRSDKLGQQLTAMVA